MHHLLLRWYAALVLRPLPERDERGDVPGWVLVTVMTAGVVSVLYALARDQLADLFTTAIHSVTD
jgi:hypothetical protein